MKAKILFTAGPASLEPAVFRRLASMAHGVRINTAHGSVKEHEAIINFVRRNSCLPIVLDIKGPEMRVVLDRPLEIRAGSTFQIGFSGKNRFSYDFSREARRGDRVFFDDGKLEAEIISFSKDGVALRAANSHTLKGGKNAHIPGRRLAIPSLSEKDLEEISLANRKGIEYVALSFARNAEDVESLRRKLAMGISIIAKIENREGLRKIDEILRPADGLMVARGDLALDIGQEKVPLAQKMMIRKCNGLGKLCITATQVLETMVENPYPTRAEVSDIANAVLDGTDALMLSGETAIGKYPVKCAETISRVAKEAESAIPCNVDLGAYASVSDAISKSIYAMARIMPLDCIVSITRSGYTARMLSRFRMKNRIVAVTPYENVRRQLNLYFGIEAVRIPSIPESRIIQTVARFLRSRGLLGMGHTALFTAGIRTKEKHASNLIEVHKIAELLG